MELMLYSLVLLLDVFFPCKAQDILRNPLREDRYRTATFARINDMAVVNISKTTYVMDSLECVSTCLAHPTCNSLHYQDNGHPRHLCELSETIVVSSPLCQIPRPGYTYYYPIKVSTPTPSHQDCSNMPSMKCKNGGTCQRLDPCGTEYTCVCQDFNTGAQCQLWIPSVSSCKDIRSKTSYRTNMAYTFNIDNKQTDVYCHLTDDICGGGGWTLTMKIDDSTSNAKFLYNSVLWKNKESLNPIAGQTGFDNQQTKMPSYWAMSFDNLCVGFKVNNVLKWIVIPYKASSLYDVINNGGYISSLSRSTWMSLYSGSSLQPNCNQGGFNVYGYARIGIRTNNENNCGSCDSAMGFGLGRTYSCGNYCGSTHCSKGGVNQKAFGYVMIK